MFLSVYKSCVSGGRSCRGLLFSSNKHILKALRPVPPIRTVAVMLLLMLLFKAMLHVKLKPCFVSNIVSSDSPSVLPYAALPPEKT